MITLTEEEAKQFTDKLKEVMEGNAQIKKDLDKLEKEVKDWFDMIGKELSDIVNQDKSKLVNPYPNIVTQIIDYLKKNSLYHPR